MREAHEGIPWGKPIGESHEGNPIGEFHREFRVTSLGGAQLSILTLLMHMLVKMNKVCEWDV